MRRTLLRLATTYARTGARRKPSSSVLGATAGIWTLDPASATLRVQSPHVVAKEACSASGQAVAVAVLVLQQLGGRRWRADCWARGVYLRRMRRGLQRHSRGGEAPFEFGRSTSSALRGADHVAKANRVRAVPYGSPRGRRRRHCRQSWHALRRLRHGYRVAARGGSGLVAGSLSAAGVRTLNGIRTRVRRNSWPPDLLISCRGSPAKDRDPRYSAFDGSGAGPSGSARNAAIWRRSSSWMTSTLRRASSTRNPNSSAMEVYSLRSARW